MDWNAFSHPGVLLSAITVLVALVTWLVRLESRQKEILQSRVDDAAERERRDNAQDARIEKLDAQLTTHRENAEIHFNLRLHQEIERRQDDRFRRVEGRLGHIEEKLDQVLAR